ncbi:MAG: MgtC/SapB family protein [Syntrophomonadaceae bacterium]
METYIFRILTAAVVGYLIGLINFKHAPVKMFSIICMGAALVSITSTEFFKLLDLPWSSDPGRLTAQVISALGFIGSGLIWIGGRHETEGLSIVANLWITAIIGILLGIGLEVISVICLILIIIIFYGPDCIERYKEQKDN